MTPLPTLLVLAALCIRFSRRTPVVRAPVDAALAQGAGKVSATPCDLYRGMPFVKSPRVVGGAINERCEPTGTEQMLEWLKLDRMLLRDSYQRRFGLLLTVIVVVVGLGIIKAAIHALGLEFLSLNPLFTSAIAGATFIIGFLLSSVLSDYKEAERIPTEIRVALEAIHDDVTGFVAHRDAAILRDVRKILAEIPKSLQIGLGHESDHAGLAPVLAKIDALSTFFVSLEKLDMPANFVVRLRSTQDTLRRSVLRIYHIQRMQFVPSVHILVQTLVAAILLLLLFLKTEGSPESALLFGFVSYMFVYALYLIGMLEQPFRKGHNSLDDVSLFLLREFEQKLEHKKTRGSN